MNILVTGGAGYIGSHFVNYLLDKDTNIYVIDNLSRGFSKSLPDEVKFFNIDICDREKLSSFFYENRIDVIVHFAAFAYVGESVENPEIYYQNNVVGSYNLITEAKNSGVKYFIFSSTCSLYGDVKNIPISENEPVNPINPYAKTKAVIEGILTDYSASSDFRYVALRYFNAAGCDESGRIGESHNPETHLIPLVLDAAAGVRQNIKVFGNDYNTLDGTCIRDYIHVNDLADAHWKAINYLLQTDKSDVFNLGTGNGFSVRQIIDSAALITGKVINTEIVGRREGDPAILIADNSKAEKQLGWKPAYTLDKIIKTAWDWHQNKKY